MYDVVVMKVHVRYVMSSLYDEFFVFRMGDSFAG